MILIIFFLFAFAILGVVIMIVVERIFRGISGADKKENNILQSISDNAAKELRPQECSNGYYIDLNERHVSPAAFFVDYEKRKLYYYHEAWESFSQGASTLTRIGISFKKIIGFELKRKGETVFNSSAISSAATGYVFAGTIGAALMSSVSEKSDIRKHERNKRMDMVINIITTSTKSPLITLPITKNNAFSSASNEVIDQTTEEILAILQQIVTLNQRAVEQEPAPELVEEAPVMRRRRRATSNDKISKLRELKDLLDSGTITQEEFDSLKKEIIG